MKNLLIIIFIAFSNNLVALESQPVTVEKLVQTTKSWNGSELPAYKPGQPEVTILKITVMPNVELPWHTHPTINAGVMIKGKLTVITKSGEENELVAGDAIVEVTGKIHRGVNNGDVPVEIIVFYAGVVDTPLTIKVE